MKLPLMVTGVVLGLAAGGSAGSYWYLAHATTAPAEEAQSEAHAFIDMERKFVVPLVRGNRVQACWSWSTSGWKSRPAARAGGWR
jgi:hypothetical protein